MITADTPFTPEDDCYHRLSDDPFETETNWWSFNIPARRIGGWLHTLYHPNRGTATWRVFVWDDQGETPGQLAYYKRVEDAPMPAETDLRDISFPGGGYSLKMLEPLMRYRMTYADPARNFGFDFVHAGTHAPKRFPPGEAPMLNNPHLDQLGHITGTLTLRGETIPIDCYSVRDRTWGPRGGPHAAARKVWPDDAARLRVPGGSRWRQIERERGRGRMQYVFGHTGPDAGFLSFVRVQDGDAAGWSPMNAGWLLKDGVFGHVDKTHSRLKTFRDPVSGWTSHQLVDVRDDLGRTIEAEGFAVSRMVDFNGSSTLMRWEFDGRTAWGEDQDRWNMVHHARMLDALRAHG